MNLTPQESFELARLHDLISNLVLDAGPYVEVGYENHPDTIAAQKALDEELKHWRRVNP